MIDRLEIQMQRSLAYKEIYRNGALGKAVRHDSVKEVELMALPCGTPSMRKPAFSCFFISRIYEHFSATREVVNPT